LRTAIATQYPKIDDYLDQIVKEVNGLKEKFPDKLNVLGCGIGAPNASSKNGTIVNAANLIWKGTVPIVDKLKSKMSMPIKIMNDASAAALGEMLFGNAKGMKDFIAITLGTGFGAGIVANGKLVEGYDGFAGELADIVEFFLCSIDKVVCSIALKNRMGELQKNCFDIDSQILDEINEQIDVDKAYGDALAASMDL